MNQSAELISQSRQKIVASWVEEHIGPVKHIEQQARWRPAWYIDAATPAGTAHLYVRCDRGGDTRAQPQPLSFEYGLQEVLLRNGLRVPRLYGFIDSIPAIVMERVAGVADLRLATSDAARAAVSSQFVDEMIKMHRVDPEQMVALGTPRPLDARDTALAYYRRMEAHYSLNKNRAAPAIEFVRGWITRNAPTDCATAYPIAVDAGQFLFDADRLTTLLDFEYAALGDYHVDLAALRLRSRFEYVGDLKTIYRQYEQRSGLPVNPRRLAFHTVVKGLLPPLFMFENLGMPTAEIDFIQYSIWNAVWLRIAIEAIAEIRGFPTETFVRPAHARPTRWGNIIDALEADAEELPGNDTVATYRRERTLRALRVARRAELFQPELEQRYIAGVAAVTHQATDSWDAADEVLEKFILQSDGSNEQALLHLLWQQQLGACFLFEDPTDINNYSLLTTPLAPLNLEPG